MSSSEQMWGLFDVFFKFLIVGGFFLVWFLFVFILWFREREKEEKERCEREKA